MDRYRDKLYTLDFYSEEDKQELGTRANHNKTKSITKTLGILERIIYAGGWLSGHPEIIAVILALKITPSLKDQPKNKIIGWTIFNMYLIGNLLSLISAIVLAEFSNFALSYIFQNLGIK